MGSSGSYLLGIDLGTMLIKAVVFTFDGREVGSSEREVDVEYPKPGWAEQDPEHLWRATTEVISEVIKKHSIRPEEIAGISLTGQMHGTFLIDEKGELARRKAIIWLDTRTKNIMEKYYENNLVETIYDVSGWRLLTSMQIMHLKWLMQNEPETLKRAKSFLACKDYIRYRLTGRALMDFTDASVTGLMDLKKKVWSDEITSLMGIPEHILPELKGSWEYAGEVTEEASEETGLKAGTPVAVGAGDICSTALGAGTVKPGQLTAIIGTAGIYELTVDNPLLDEKRAYSVACHAIPDMWLLEAVQMTAGAALRWFRDEFCGEEIEEARRRGVSSYVLLDEKAEKSPIGANGVIFHPFLQGERSPFVNPDARGLFFGLGLWTRKGDAVRAILEGVALAAKDNVELFRQRGIKIEEARITGGGARSPLWSQILADALGIKITVPRVKECGALGSAIEAGVASGVFKNPVEGAEKMVEVEREYHPDLGNTEKYEKIYKLYRRLYETLWEIYKEASNTYSSL